MTARTLTPFDPDVVRAWTLGDGRRGVLLIHGFAGTPPELRRLGIHLSSHGYLCSGPALAGHATTPEALENSTRGDWIASAQMAFEELCARCDQVMVAGQSMGGTLALHLAANDLRVAAVVTLAAPLWLTGFAHRLLPVVKHVMRWHRPGQDVDLYDPNAIEELYSHGLRSTRAIHEFTQLIAEVRDELPSIRAPVLVLHGGRDRTVDPGNAEEIERRLVCSQEVSRVVFPRSGHGMSVDVDHPAINDAVLRWFSDHGRAAIASQGRDGSAIAG